MAAGFQMPGIPQPPLMNQPPQIFGGDGYHGLPIQHLPPELTAQMFGDPSALLDDANEAKRRRIARVSLSLAPARHESQRQPGNPMANHDARHILRRLDADHHANPLQACDMCRKKKIKCDGKLPACTHCINYKTDCVFTQVEKKRNPPKG